jgi:hypothetical protein
MRPRDGLWAPVDSGRTGPFGVCTVFIGVPIATLLRRYDCLAAGSAVCPHGVDTVGRLEERAWGEPW